MSDNDESQDNDKSKITPDEFERLQAVQQGALNWRNGIESAIASQNLGSFNVEGYRSYMKTYVDTAKELKDKYPDDERVKTIYDQANAWANE